jgi:hypothetical protein
METRALIITGILLAVVLCAAVRAGEQKGKSQPPATNGSRQAGEPLARVNGFAITTEDVERYLRVTQTGPQQPVAHEAAALMEQEQFEAQKKKDALKALIEMRLLYELGKDEYFSSDRAQEALKKIGEDEWRKFQERAGSKVRAIQRLSEVGLSVDQYKDLLVQNLVAGQYLREKVNARVSVSPTDVRAYYEAHPEDFKVPRTVVYRQILFTVADKDDEPLQSQKADEALKRTKAGEDFAKIADSCSDERERWLGGLHEVQVPEGLGEWLPPAVQGLAVGQVSEVRRVGGGFCIARLEQVRPPRTAPFEEVQGTIKARLFSRKHAAAQAEYLDEVKGKARIEYCAAAVQLGLP